MLAPNKKYIFLVVSHLNDKTDLIYELPKNYNKFGLAEEYSELKEVDEHILFKVRVFSISFNESNLNDSESELIINLKISQLESFEGKIKFNKNKENLIYDFSFDILHKGKEDVYPPNTLNLSYYDKFYLFNQVLKNNSQNNESLFNSLLEDSLNLLKINCDYYYIDFYLYLLCNSYKSQKIIFVLSYYDLEKIKFFVKNKYKGNFSCFRRN